MQKHSLIVLLAALALTGLLALGGCQSAPTDPTASIGGPSSTVSTASTTTASAAGLQDGERFESVVMREGSDETVAFEHIRNTEAGFELNYAYEALVRQTTPAFERFVSRYDNADDPQNYLEIERRYDGADAVEASIKEAFAAVYQTVGSEQFTLDGAGACTRIFTADPKSGITSSSILQTAYIIPTADGCILATAHYTIESAEGFGATFFDVVNSLTLLD